MSIGIAGNYAPANASKWAKRGTAALLAGAIFLSAPATIRSASFIVLKTLLFDTLIGLIPGGSAPFLQSANLINSLTDGASAGPAFTSLIVWILLPLGIRFWRNQHKEV